MTLEQQVLQIIRANVDPKTGALLYIDQERVAKKIVEALDPFDGLEDMEMFKFKPSK